jgi:hypothetical protein
MRPERVERELLHRIKRSRRAVRSLDPAGGIRLTLEFYRDERAVQPWLGASAASGER